MHSISHEEDLSQSQLSDKPTGFPRINVSLLGRQISFITIPELLREVEQACQDRQRLVIAFFNVYSFNLALHLPWFDTFMRRADIVPCDGSGILKAIKFLGLRLPLEYRTPGTVFVPELLRCGSDLDLSFFLLGAKPEHLQTALQKIKKDYPSLTIAGHHGYFDRDDAQQNASIVQKINRANPDILIVGMGMPTQEQWIAHNMDNLNVRVIIPCGAIIDRLAGAVPNCPYWVSDVGLEWLYRLMREPKRLAKRYLAGNLAFALQLVLATAYSRPLKVSRAALKKSKLKLVDGSSVDLS